MSSDNPSIKTPNRKHQQEEFDRVKDLDRWGLFWEMGLGKTKLLIDVASHQHRRGKIEALLVLAPNSVYANWPLVEMPLHMAANHMSIRYKTGAGRKQKLRQLLILDPTWEPHRLRVVAMSYDSLRTDDGYEFAKKFVTMYKTMIVADESTAIKNGSSLTAKKAKKIRARCHTAWIATGTPISNNAFDIHSQIEFLDEDFWAQYGVKSMTAFKNQFAIFRERRIAGGRSFPELQEYRNLDKLFAILKTISSRLLKEDSGVELPPKTYTTRTFEMTTEQRRRYEELREQYVIESDAPEFFVEAALAIVRLTRLQQIASGFVKADMFDMDEDGELTLKRPEPKPDAPAYSENPFGQMTIDDYEAALKFELENASPEMPNEIKAVKTTSKVIDLVEPGKNPRLALLLEIIEQVSHKVIVWCRFKHSVQLICDALGENCVRYDGSVDTKQRLKNLDAFKDPRGPKVFVANVHAISMGVTLNIAKTAVYYENTFSLEKRLQSEDRFHRIGQDSPVQIIDLAAEDTVDFRLIEVLRQKYDLAATINGDRYREWISREEEE